MPRVQHGRLHAGREPTGPIIGEQDRPTPEDLAPQVVLPGPAAYKGTDEEVLGHAHGTPGRPELAVGPQPRHDIMMGPQTEERKGGQSTGQAHREHRQQRRRAR